ncbi:MAG: adenylate/guanylate cyclase domain-containing protein [Bacteroidota bacterium]
MKIGFRNIFKRKDQRFSYKLRQWFLLSVFWILMGIIIPVYDHLLMLGNFPPEQLVNQELSVDLAYNISASILASLLAGPSLVFLVNNRVQRRSYGYAILSVVGSFVVVMIIVTSIIGISLAKVNSGEFPFFSERASRIFWAYLFSPFQLKLILVWSLITMATQFFFQVNDKFGPGLLWDFIRGKYREPQEEMRIFMILDITGSTKIAEKLGNKDYYNLLRDFFADITPAIVDNRGEIYQYVGDEVVVSWEYPEGFNIKNCINCYFDARERLAKLESKYLEKYGLLPEFKASINAGPVTAGEIGIIKKDITYSGDVLNTTARILGKCKEYQRNLLISGSLISKIEGYKAISFERMGSVLLRGKSESIEIYAIDKT